MFLEDTNQIFNTLKGALTANPNRTFSLEHVGFLYQFFKDKPEEDIKKNIIELIQAGQIEILNQAVVAMQDEACSYYQDIITSYREGSRWFDKNIESGPEIRSQIGYKIDSFGHSLGTMRLMSLNNLTSMVIGRADSVQKRIRGYENTLMFNWIYSGKDRQEVSTKTYLLYAHYDYYRLTRTFFLNRNFNTNFINPMSYRFDSSMESMVKIVKELNFIADRHIERILPVLLGTDFDYYDANGRYLKMDAFIVFIKSQQNSTFKDVVIDYSSFRSFFMETQIANETLVKAKKMPPGKGDVENEDFFPLISRVSEYFQDEGTWTGFYTSHPWYKKSFVEYGRIVRLIKTMVALDVFGGEISYKMLNQVGKPLAEASYWNGVLTHHDAISGTSPPGVMYDYFRNLLIHLERLSLMVKVKRRGYETVKGLKICHQFQGSDIGGCVFDYKAKVGDKMMAVVVSPKFIANQKTKKRKFDNFVEFYFEDDYDTKTMWNLTRVDDFKTIDAEVECDDTAGKLYGPICRFVYPIEVRDALTPVWFTKVKREPSTTKKWIKFQNHTFKVGKHSFEVGYAKEKYGVVLKSNSGLNFEAGWFVHEGRSDMRIKENDGHYVLSFKRQRRERIKIFNLRYFESPRYYKVMVDDLEENFGSFEFRISKDPNNYKDDTFQFKFVHQVNNLDKIRPGIPVEFFASYKIFGLINLNEFYTDSNGLDMVKRTFARRAKYKETQFAREMNYYPVTKMMYAESAWPAGNKLAAGVMVGRPEAGTVNEEGMFELNLQRKTFANDHKGVRDNMLEDAKVIPIHTLVLSKKGVGEVRRVLRRLQIDDENKPFLSFGATSLKSIREVKERILNQKNTFSKVFGDVVEKGVQVDLEADTDAMYAGMNRMRLTMTNLGSAEPLKIENLKKRLNLVSKASKLQVGKIEKVWLNYRKIHDLKTDNKKNEVKEKKNEIDYSEAFLLKPMEILTLSVDFTEKKK